MSGKDTNKPDGTAPSPRQVGQLLRMTAHDLRTPLSAMGTWLDLLRDAANPADRARAEAVLREQLDLLARIADDSALGGGLVDGRLTLDPLFTELGSMVRAAVDVWRPSAARRGLEIVLGAMPDSWVQVDLERMRHAFVNLTGHAIRMARAPRPWSVAIEHRAHCAAVRLDWPEEAVGQLKPLAYCLQAKPAGEKVEPSLALALAWEIVTLHQGRVAIERDEGRTAVVVELPLRERA